MSALHCPDCTGLVDQERHLAHDGSCPLAAGVEAACDGDRDWFLAHPGAVAYVRPITWAERQEGLAYGAGVRAATHVEVTQIRPGVRLRRPFSVFARGTK